MTMSPKYNEPEPEVPVAASRPDSGEELVAASPHNTYGSAQAVYGSPLSRYPHEHAQAIGDQDTSPVTATAEVEAA
jgi:hypothetical protein